MSGLAHRAPALVCHDCDQLHEEPRLSSGEVAACTRCGSVLARGKHDVAVRTFAYSIASIFLLALANSFPFMTYEIAGRMQVSRLWSGVLQLHSDGYWELALIVLFSSILAPVILLLCLSSLTGAMLMGRRFAWMPTAIKVATKIKTWSMMEVFLLAVAVSTIKLSQLADVSQGPSLYAFIGLILTSSLALSAFEPAVAWAYIDGEDSA